MNNAGSTGTQWTMVSYFKKKLNSNAAIQVKFHTLKSKAVNKKLKTTINYSPDPSYPRTP